MPEIDFWKQAIDVLTALGLDAVLVIGTIIATQTITTFLRKNIEMNVKLPHISGKISETVFSKRMAEARDFAVKRAELWFVFIPFAIGLIISFVIFINKHGDGLMLIRGWFGYGLIPAGFYKMWKAYRDRNKYVQK